MNLGERIYKLRTEKNLSQGDLADALEVSRQSISKWETNSSVPELDKLVRLCEIFGVSLDELVTGNERIQPSSAPQTEPQVIYVEKSAKSGITAAQILGTVLLSCSLLCLVLFACFGEQRNIGDVFLLCLPVALWGILCLVTRFPLLWCGWCSSITWWIYVFILCHKWEETVLLLIVGIALVIVSLLYTLFLWKKKRIQIPAWGWASIAVVLTVAALLLIINLLPASVVNVELVGVEISPLVTQ